VRRRHGGGEARAHRCELQRIGAWEWSPGIAMKDARHPPATVPQAAG
jgi:hypothetical protein